MKDINHAKRLLESMNYTCVVVKDETVYTSDKSGIAPMMMWLQNKSDLTGFSVADKIVGKAAAMLFVKAGIVRVHAQLISEAGKAFLDLHHIPYTYDASCEYIVNRKNTGMCPMETTVKDLMNEEEAFVALGKKVEELKKNGMKKKVVIDTDAGVDDAMAIMYLLSDPMVEVQAITVVSGNVPLEQGVKNVLAIVEQVRPQNNRVPVYAGCARPLVRELRVASHIHGHDGMGDCGLVHPTIEAQEISAIEYYLTQLDSQADIIALGPLTNLATVVQQNAETMRGHVVYIMGSSGLGAGNITPYAEYNAYVDAEAFDIVAKSQANLTYLGFDVCRNESIFQRKEFEPLKDSTPYALWYYTAINSAMDHRGMKEDGKVGIADAITTCAYRHPEWITTSKAYIETITTDDEHYGQVNFTLDENGPVTLVTSVDSVKMKQNLIEQIGKR